MLASTAACAVTADVLLQVVRLKKQVDDLEATMDLMAARLEACVPAEAHTSAAAAEAWAPVRECSTTTRAIAASRTGDGPSHVQTVLHRPRAAYPAAEACMQR